MTRNGRPWEIKIPCRGGETRTRNDAVGGSDMGQPPILYPCTHMPVPGLQIMALGMSGIHVIMPMIRVIDVVMGDG